MTFRNFLSLFKDCDHPWGDLAQDATRDKRWKGDDALSLSLLIPDRSVQLVCHDVNVAYLMFIKPVGLNLDLSARLAQCQTHDSSVEPIDSNPRNYVD
jgi:hypothetical protein